MRDEIRRFFENHEYLTLVEFENNMVTYKCEDCGLILTRDEKTLFKEQGNHNCPKHKEGKVYTVSLKEQGRGSAKIEPKNTKKKRKRRRKKRATSLAATRYVNRTLKENGYFGTVISSKSVRTKNHFRYEVSLSKQGKVQKLIVDTTTNTVKSKTKTKK